MSEQEWSYFVDSDDIGFKVFNLEISPPKDVKRALCSRLNLHSINELKASLSLQRNNVNKVIHVTGSFLADISQKCVVTTDMVEKVINEELEAWFTDPNSAVSFVKAKRERMSRKEKDNFPMMEECDDPEEIIDGKIDLGELVIQNLSLALPPYPRTHGAEYENKDKALGDAPEGTYDNPFAALKDWKDGEAKKDS